MIEAIRRNKETNQKAHNSTEEAEVCGVDEISHESTNEVIADVPRKPGMVRYDSRTVSTTSTLSVSTNIASEACLCIPGSNLHASSEPSSTCCGGTVAVVEHKEYSNRSGCCEPEDLFYINHHSPTFFSTTGADVINTTPLFASSPAFFPDNSVHGIMSNTNDIAETQQGDIRSSSSNEGRRLLKQLSNLSDSGRSVTVPGMSIPAMVSSFQSMPASSPRKINNGTDIDATPKIQHIRSNSYPHVMPSTFSADVDIQAIFRSPTNSSVCSSGVSSSQSRVNNASVATSLPNAGSIAAPLSSANPSQIVISPSSPYSYTQSNPRIYHHSPQNSDLSSFTNYPPISAAPSDDMSARGGGVNNEKPFMPCLAEKSNSIMLGLKQLERQQAEQERARQRHAVDTSNRNTTLQLPTHIHVGNSAFTSERSIASSCANSVSSPASQQNSVNSPASQQSVTNIVGPLSPFNGSANNPAPPQHPPSANHPIDHHDDQFMNNLAQLESNEAPKALTNRTFTSMFKSPLKRKIPSVDDAADPKNLKMSDENYDSDDDDSIEVPSALVAGYLHKHGRNGRWQRRYFETDGQCLRYYKTDKRKKLLASLDLIKVGEISVDTEDESGCTFTIQVAGNPYYIRADNDGICQDWVINLNRVREARLQEGGIKLVHPGFQPSSDAADLLPQDAGNRKRSESSTDLFTRVILDANRTRTRKAMPDMERIETISTNSGISSTFVAKWQKHQTRFEMIRYRIARFVSKLRKNRCISRNDVVDATHPSGNIHFHYHIYPQFYEDGGTDDTASMTLGRSVETTQIDVGSIGNHSTERLARNTSIGSKDMQSSPSTRPKSSSDGDLIGFA